VPVARLGPDRRDPLADVGDGSREQQLVGGAEVGAPPDLRRRRAVEECAVAVVGQLVVKRPSPQTSLSASTAWAVT